MVSGALLVSGLSQKHGLGQGRANIIFFWAREEDDLAGTPWYNTHAYITCTREASSKNVYTEVRGIDVHGSSKWCRCHQRAHIHLQHPLDSGDLRHRADRAAAFSSAGPIHSALLYFWAACMWLLDTKRGAMLCDRFLRATPQLSPAAGPRVPFRVSVFCVCLCKCESTGSSRPRKIAEADDALTALKKLRRQSQKRAFGCGETKASRGKKNAATGWSGRGRNKSLGGKKVAAVERSGEKQSSLAEKSCHDGWSEFFCKARRRQK